MSYYYFCRMILFYGWLVDWYSYDDRLKVLEDYIKKIDDNSDTLLPKLDVEFELLYAFQTNLELSYINFLFLYPYK